VDGLPALKAIAPTIAEVSEIGLSLEKIADAASLDEGIAEFSRFYLERREQGVRFAGSDERKSRKLHEEFTPRFEATVVALDGKVYREITARTQYEIDEGANYESLVSTFPCSEEISRAPAFAARDREVERGQVATVEMPYQIGSSEMNALRGLPHLSKANAIAACMTTLCGRAWAGTPKASCSRSSRA
jgi:hypothetical protein